VDKAMLKQPFWFWFGWFYGLFVSLWLILRLLSGDRLWWVALLSAIALYLFIPLPILFVASLWNRRWRLLLGLSIPMIGLILFYAPLFLPSWPEFRQGEGRSLSVMTYNIQLGNLNHLPLVKAIRAAAPDIVALQELTPELIPMLLQDLAADYPYTTLTLPVQENLETVGILSRFPIESTTSFPLPGRRYGIDVKTKTEFSTSGPRLGVKAVLQLDHQRIQVATADLIHNPVLQVPFNQFTSVAIDHYSQKAREIQQIQQELDKQSLPFLFLCDCNIQDTLAAHAQFAAFAKDSFWEVGWGFGNTVNANTMPMNRLDYIWHSPQFVALEAAVGVNGGSDHLPVVAHLKLD
jgi:vancomycin resistance protein VanJ